MIKNISIIIITLLSINVAFAAIADKRVKEERKTSNFNTIAIKSSTDVYFTQAEEFRIVVMAEQDEIDKIITKVVDNQLIVDSKRNTRISWNTNSHSPVVLVFAPSLTAVHISGSGDFETDGELKEDDFELKVNGSGDFEARLDVENMSIHISGSGDCEFSGVNHSLRVSINGSGDVEGTDLNLNKLKVEQYGSGDIELSGKTEELYLKQSGSGDYDGRNIQATTARVSKSGSGDAFLYCAEALDVNSSGSGDTYVYGNPTKVRESTHGSGDLYIK